MKNIKQAAEAALEGFANVWENKLKAKEHKNCALF